MSVEMMVEPTAAWMADSKAVQRVDLTAVHWAVHWVDKKAVNLVAYWAEQSVALKAEYLAVR